MKIDRTLAVFDLETTGKTTMDRIVEIAIIKLHMDGSTTIKKKLINPGIPIPKEATDVHGITDEMVKDAPKFIEISKALKQELSDCDLAGYNSNRYDVPLLVNEFARCEIIFPDPGTKLLDVYKVETILNSNKLSDTYKRYFNEELDGAHGAEADAMATLKILLEQTSRSKDRLNAIVDNKDNEGELSVTQLAELCKDDFEIFDYSRKFYLKDGVPHWAFGKHLNQPLDIVDQRGYINWCLGLQDFPIETKLKLKALLTANN